MALAVCNAASMSPGSRNCLLLLGMVRPDAGIAIGLQFNAHLKPVGGDLAACGLLRGLLLRQGAEQILHVMADLVRDHISLREFAGVARATMEARLDLFEERGVEIDALVVGQ